MPQLKCFVLALMYRKYFNAYILELSKTPQTHMHMVGGELRHPAAPYQHSYGECVPFVCGEARPPMFKCQSLLRILIYLHSIYSYNELMINDLAVAAAKCAPCVSRIYIK